jgi:hypothetical protein
LCPIGHKYAIVFEELFHEPCLIANRTHSTNAHRTPSPCIRTFGRDRTSKLKTGIMPEHFRLSGRQRKQLLERGAVVRVALPLPLYWPDESTDAELRRYVLAQLPEDVTAGRIKSVEEMLVGVIPKGGLSSDAAGMLGMIILGKEARERFHLTVSVVVADLCCEDTPRNPPTRIQWPGDVSMFFPLRSEESSTEHAVDPIVPTDRT